MPMDAPQSLYSQLWERGVKQTVLSLVLNVGRHCKDVTSDGRLFQVLAAVTGNARSPIVEGRVIYSQCRVLYSNISNESENYVLQVQASERTFLFIKINISSFHVLNTTFGREDAPRKLG